MEDRWLSSQDLEPLFWTPQLVGKASAWWGHVPFAFWLIAKTKPQLLVELGTHHGVSYAAFCEAISRLRLSTRCYAVDSWTGDPHAGAYEEDVFAELKEFHDKRYASFSQLVHRTFDEARSDFADGTIDLLHIDGFHTYETVRHDFETWRAKLSSRAVVVLHDTNERQRDFGVWRFLDELKQEFPAFEFLHSHGLGVVAVGADAPEAVKRLCGLTNGAEIAALRERFSLIGARWIAEQERSNLAARARTLESQVRAAKDEITQRSTQISDLQSLLSKAQKQRDDGLREKDQELREKDRVIGEQQARIERLNQVLGDQQAEIAQTNELRKQLADARRRPGKVLRDLVRHRVLTYLSTKSPPLPARMTVRLVKSAQKRDPNRSLGTSVVSDAPERTLGWREPAAVLDEWKKTILVVSHEATRSGAPILALNIIQQLSPRYNVVSLILGAGELTDHFRQASASLYVADRIRMTDQDLDNVIQDIVAQNQLAFGIVSSVESRGVLRALKAAGVPTVSLIHEFSSYIRPRSAFPDVLTLSTEIVFSSKMTLENAIADFCLCPGASIHVAPQGKCNVPTNPGVASDASVEKAWLTSLLRPERGSRKFLVIGIGKVELRKGVDLFLDCATIIKNQSGGEKFQFAWIGDGFDPECDGAYSVYLADQINRAGLGPQMRILRSTSQIELAYQCADLLLISSRLDPLPNVAIDALIAGLPVLCFEMTTGIADFLSDSGLGEQCVAQYLDTHDLARKVMALADSDELRAIVSERSRAAAKSAFDMNAYVAKIEAIATQAVGNEALVKQEVDAILASGKFRSDFFKHSSTESLPEEKIIEDYILRAAVGLVVRKPMPGFHPTVYSWLQAREGKTNGDPFVDFLRKGLPEGPWLQRVIQNRDIPKSPPDAKPRVAAHLHVFYTDQLAGMVERLKLNASAPDLFISVPTEDKAAEAREAFLGYRGQIIDVQVTPNLGRDIGPLVTQFGPALSASYDIIGHLHTKKSAHVANRPTAEAWITFLLENLLGGKDGGAMLDSILSSMASDPMIGIVFPDDPHVMSWTGNRKYAEDLSARMKCGELPEQFNFPIGSMFWMRSAVLKKFVELDLTWDDYAPEPLPYDGTLIHAIERLFGVVPAAMGMTCAVTNVRGLTR